MPKIEDINTLPNNAYTFCNYFNCQDDISQLKAINYKNFYSCIISGKPGSGVTHILNAICCENIKKNKRVMSITSQWLLYFFKKYKTIEEKNKLNTYLLSFDVLAIDNVQFLYRKSQAHSNHFINLLKLMRKCGKTIILGCSDISKDFTKSKQFEKNFNWRRIELKEVSGYDIYLALKSLCAAEDNVPDKLLYVISAYNGTMQEHINCLISVRFNAKLKQLNSDEITQEQLNEEFELKKYFPKQQFRKTYIQSEINFPKKIYSAQEFKFLNAKTGL